MQIENFIEKVKSDHWSSHIILESLGDAGVDLKDVIGENYDDFTFEIVINGTTISAEGFMKAIARNYEGWTDQFEDKIKAGVKDYVRKQKLELSDKLVDAMDAVESLRTKIDSLDDSIGWDDKLLKEVADDVERGVKQVTHVQFQSDGLLDRDGGTSKVEYPIQRL